MAWLGFFYASVVSCANLFLNLSQASGLTWDTWIDLPVISHPPAGQLRSFTRGDRGPERGQVCRAY